MKWQLRRKGAADSERLTPFIWSVKVEHLPATHSLSNSFLVIAAVSKCPK